GRCRIAAAATGRGAAAPLAVADRAGACRAAAPCAVRAFYAGGNPGIDIRPDLRASRRVCDPGECTARPCPDRGSWECPGRAGRSERVRTLPRSAWAGDERGRGGPAVEQGRRQRLSDGAHRLRVTTRLREPFYDSSMVSPD